jgi:hypothetical protein
MFRSANCCGYAVGPFPDALACRSACAEYAASAGRGTSDCNLQGQRQCDAPSETWLPCDAASGARAASGRCTLATGRAVSCVCR